MPGAPYTVTTASGEQSKPQCCGVDPACYHHSCNVIQAPGQADGYGGYSQGYCMPMSDNVPAVDYCAPSKAWLHRVVVTRNLNIKFC